MDAYSKMGQTHATVFAWEYRPAQLAGDLCQAHKWDSVCPYVCGKLFVDRLIAMLTIS